MKYDKKDTAKLIEKKLSGKSFLTYKEIADITGYHPKYILRLKKEILDNTFNTEHGNKNRTPINKMSTEEEEKIVNLFKRSNTSIRKFVKFYGTRSYSCIYNILEKNNLIK
jgi:hypothetical protein